MSELFLKIVNMSISASYLVAAVLLLRLVLKKAPKWVSVLLWGMVAIRLICPISIESVLSLIPSTQTVSPEIMMDRTPEVSTGIPAVDTVVNPVITETFAPEPIASANPLQILIPVSANLWLLGVLVMLGYTAVSYLMLRRKLATAVRLKNNIYQCENVDSPFVLGMVRPRIYLPFRMDGKNLNHVIAHEEAHIRRKDHWWKPMGFVLLAIHWFNPLMWVGYILLCRDIELACDEKVIKEMDNETKADYMQALVSCSVNRRSIAACPLAFGEVGVKERVKTVMNYKKPAFWIVIAAVALCIVVAVSFLTNPKGYGPKVGNPKMLELPGVEWFVTPEEFKEALNITKKQIISEDINSLPGDTDGSDDTYELSVTDLTLFGKEVHYALFSFDRAPDGEFELVQAVVMFDEDTDMEQLKDNLVEIYGTGSSEPYSYYLYQGNVKQNHIHKSRMEQDLEYRSMNDRFLEGLDGNPFKDALEDPDYMTHHWVTENGCSLIPEEVVEWFKYAMDRPANADEVALQDDEVLMEMLDQLPWVAMTLSNRNAATIQQDAQGTNNESIAYYTNNYIEFNAGWLAQYRHEVRETQMSNPSLLEFPGLKWGMTPEEVKAALNLSEDQIAYEYSYAEQDYDGWLGVTGLEYFGGEIQAARFQFCSNSEAEPALYRIELYYTDETDMAAIRDNLIEQYGPGTNMGYTDYVFVDNTVKSAVHNNRTGIGKYGETIEPNATSSINHHDIVHCWPSSVKGSDILTPEAVEGFIATMGDSEGVYASREDVLKWIDNHVWVVLRCANNSDRDDYINRSVVFSAEYVVINQRYGLTAATKPTEQEEPTMSYDLPWLQYPDISWGVQPYKIKEILNVTEEQILVDEVTPGGYTLHIKDLTFLDDQLVSGQFNFLTTSAGQYLLTNITLYYPEETDMAVVRDGLAAYYGPANDGEGFTRYRMTDTATVEAYTDYGIVLPEALDGAGVNAWWQSEVVMANELAESEQNMLAYRAVLMNDHNEAFRDACLEYLKKESVNFICCTDSYDLTGSDNPYCTKNVVYMSAVDIITTLYK